MDFSTTRVPHLSVQSISKHFGGVRALDGIDMELTKGHIHALVGENGAGKSTLSKICGGSVAPDSGYIIIDGRPVSLHSPRQALSYGIATIAQELALAPNLTVEQNVFLGVEPKSLRFISARKLRSAYARLTETVGFDLPAKTPVSQLRTADQQKVEIMRALSRGASMIILDEPTAALSQADTIRLHSIMKSLVDNGCTLLLISHFLSEVLALADEITILRDGKLVRNTTASAETQNSLISAMLGRNLDSIYPSKSEVPSNSDVVLRVSDLTAPGVTNISLTVGAGEVVGIAGLVGSGRSELARAIVGASKSSSGRVMIAGNAVRTKSPRDALAEGIFMIPESRKEQGLILRRSISENVNLSTLSMVSRFGFVSSEREAIRVHEILKEVGVKVANPRHAVQTLSGGNQQKVLFARALLCNPRVFIADEPTRGIDVGSRRSIYDLIIAQSKKGTATIVISSDVEELLALSHRILVMRSGQIVAELAGEDLNEETILMAAFTETKKFTHKGIDA